MYPVRRAVDYTYALTYGNGRINGDFNYYPPPSRGVVGDMWHVPSNNDRHDVSYDCAYKKHEYKQGRGEFPVFNRKDGIENLGGEMQMNEVVGTYGHGHEKEHIISRTYGRTSMGYTGLMTKATNDVGIAVEMLMDVASGGGAKLGSRIGELESPVNYYQRCGNSSIWLPGSLPWENQQNITDQNLMNENDDTVNSTCMHAYSRI